MQLSLSLTGKVGVGSSLRNLSEAHLKGLRCDTNASEYADARATGLINTCLKHPSLLLSDLLKGSVFLDYDLCLCSGGHISGNSYYIVSKLEIMQKTMEKK